jgi:hypothetical protein
MLLFATAFPCDALSIIHTLLLYAYKVQQHLLQHRVQCNSILVYIQLA